MSKRPFILFITGTSASGKTTLYESLKADSSLKGINFHDIDENGVPPVGRGPWRAFRVQELLHQANKNLSDGVSTIISGISKPYEIIESKLFDPTLNINFLVLDIPIETYKTRMAPRLEAATKHGDNEAAFEDFEEENLINTKNLRRVLKNSVLSHKKGYLLDVSKFTKKQMHDEVVKIIAKVQGQ